MSTPVVSAGLVGTRPADPSAASADGIGRFRTDVQGLRAIAVAIVVLYHASMPLLTGGYVGVDVFLVLSGFVITGLLLRELQSGGKISFIEFYARRVRRILPMATVVTMATIVGTYLVLGAYAGPLAAEDGRWAALFAGNIRFAVLGTSYLGSQQAPSPLQHMWSLGVEEQFYFVWPILLALLAVGCRTWKSMVRRMCVVFPVVIVASYLWAVAQTDQNGAWAFFSPLTRAGELALGALVAVTASYAAALPARIGDLLVAVGMVGILYSAFAFDHTTNWPGTAVMLPTAATALILVGGASGRGLLLRALGSGPLGWLGSRSYSLYLWHWPLLILAAQRAGTERLPWMDAAVLISVAVVLAELSHRLVEEPVRSSRHLKARPVLSVALGAGMVLASVGLSTFLITYF